MEGSWGPTACTGEDYPHSGYRIWVWAFRRLVYEAAVPARAVLEEGEGKDVFFWVKVENVHRQFELNFCL